MDGGAYELIVRNLQEVVGDEELRRQLASPCVAPDDRLSLYWGTATTGRPHVAYFVPIIKLADFLRAGCKVIVMFADLHGYLDNMKAPWPLLRLRTRYYEAVIKGMLQSINVPLDRLTFFRGADFELTEAYAADLYRLLAVISVHDARKAGAEVVKQVSNPLVSGLLYPLLQANDEVHLGVRAQFGGVDQRKIFMLAEKYLPHIGQSKRIHLMNPMVPGLTGGKMSASEVDSKIDLLDSREVVSRKLAQAVCGTGQSADGGNGILAFLKYVVFPLTGEDQGLLIPGHTEAYHRFCDLETDFLEGRLSGDALKQVVSDCLNDRLDVIRDQFAASPQLTDLIQQAYPTGSQAAGVEALSSEMAHVSISPVHSTSQEEPLSRRLDEMTQRMKPIQNRDAVLRTVHEELSDLEPELKRTHQLIHEGSRIRLLWSVTPVGLPHLGYSLPMRSLAKLSHLDGVLIVILVNNVAAHLRGAIPWDLVVPRGTFYRTLLTGLFKAYRGRTEQMVCVLGSEYQLSGNFMLEFYHLASMVPDSDCQAALVDTDLPLADTPEDSELTSAPVLGQSTTTTTTVGSRFVLGQLLLPCLDLIDSVYLRADIRLAGEAACRWRRAFEQRMIGKFLASSSLVCLSHPLLPGLLTTGDGHKDELCLRPMQPCQPVGHQRLAATGQQLWSDEDACLPLVEPDSAGVPGGVLAGVKRRLKKAFCRPGLVEVNPVLDVYRHVLLPELTQQEPLVIPRSEKNGGPLRVTTEDTSLQCRWAGLCCLFAEGTLHPGDLKPAVEVGLAGTLTDRLTTCLPAWSHLSAELEAAFPATSKQKAKAKAKPTSRQKVVGDKRSSGLCNGGSSSVAAVPSQPITNGGSRGRKSETDDNEAGDMDPNRLDIRVGRIISVKQHPNTNDLYVEEVDLGAELGTRTVCSGLVGHVPREQLENLLGAFVVNLKPEIMRGVVSQAMLLCTSHGTRDSQLGSTQPVQVHDSLCPGTRLVFQPPPTGDNLEMPRQPDGQLGTKSRLLDRLAVELIVSAGPDRCVSWRQWRLGPATGSADGGNRNNCA